MKKLSILLAALLLTAGQIAIAGAVDLVGQGKVPFMVEPSTGRAFYVRRGVHKLVSRHESRRPQSRLPGTARPVPHHPTVEITLPPDGEPISASVGTHIRYTFRAMTQRPIETRLAYCTEGMFHVISPGGRNEPIELEILNGSQGGRGRIDIWGATPGGEFRGWNQVFPLGIRATSRP